MSISCLRACAGNPVFLNPNQISDEQNVECDSFLNIGIIIMAYVIGGFDLVILVRYYILYCVLELFPYQRRFESLEFFGLCYLECRILISV